MAVNEFEAFLNEFDVLLGDMQLAGILGLVLILYVGIMAFGILSYVLESIGMYSIAKRRGLNNPWLAWLPVGNLWILGLIGDKDSEKRGGKDSKLRVWLLALSLGMVVLAVGMMVAVVILIISAASMNVGGSGPAYDTAQNTAMSVLLVVVAVYLVMLLVAITASVLQYVAYFRMFRSCRPENAAMYLVLGIFFSFLMPFFVFACRKYDAPLPTQYNYAPPVQPVQ